MSEFKNKTEDLTQHLGDLAETYYKLGVLKIADKVTSAGANALATILVTLLSIFVLFFAGIGLGWWLGELLNNMVAGFLLVAAFFLIVMIVIVLIRKSIVFPLIRNRFIRKAYEKI